MRFAVDFSRIWWSIIDSISQTFPNFSRPLICVSERKKWHKWMPICNEPFSPLNTVGLIGQWRPTRHLFTSSNHQRFNDSMIQPPSRPLSMFNTMFNWFNWFLKISSGTPGKARPSATWSCQVPRGVGAQAERRCPRCPRFFATDLVAKLRNRPLESAGKPPRSTCRRWLGDFTSFAVSLLSL